MLSLNQIIDNVSSFIVLLLNGFDYITIALNAFVESHINNIPQYQLYITSSDTDYGFNKALQETCELVYEIVMLVFIGMQYLALLYIYKQLNGYDSIC